MDIHNLTLKFLVILRVVPKKLNFNSKNHLPLIILLKITKDRRAWFYQTILHKIVITNKREIHMLFLKESSTINMTS